jgi:hypothetical protein
LEKGLMVKEASMKELRQLTHLTTAMKMASFVNRLKATRDFSGSKP